VHPVTKGAKEFGFRRWGHHGGSWRHKSDCLKEVDKVARAYKKMATAAASIAKASDVLEMLLKRLECVCIELLKRQPSISRPERESLHATNEMRDAAVLVAAFFEPTNERIEVGASGSRAILFQCPRGFNIGCQHAALLHGRP